MTKAVETHILVAGQFPPPVNGFSYVTQELSRLLSLRNHVRTIDLAPHIVRSGVTYHLRRAILALSGAMKIVRQRLKATVTPSLYFACEGGFGLIYIIILVLAARLVGAQIYLHHHSFYYIDRYFFPMAFALKLLGASTVHIFLSKDMAQRFSDCYRLRAQYIVLSNSAFVEPLQLTPRSAQSGPYSLTIGLLSNLSEEKGLGRFIETLRRAKADHIIVKGILAGPASGQDLQAIEDAKRELGDLLDYRGPVYGENKLAFYGDIDVFVFPTHYPNEAQPTVIFEAMACAVPILSCNRGCIKGQVADAGAVTDQKADFPSFAVGHLTQWIANPKAFEMLRLDTREQFLKDREKAFETAINLFSKTPLTIEPL